MADHPCPVPGCQGSVAGEYLMCRSHWYRVPPGIRREVWSAYRQEPMGKAHLAAMVRAVQAVERREPPG